jgi:hypothetical protein
MYLELKKRTAGHNPTREELREHRKKHDLLMKQKMEELKSKKFDNKGSPFRRKVDSISLVKREKKNRDGDGRESRNVADYTTDETSMPSRLRAAVAAAATHDVVADASGLVSDSRKSKADTDTDTNTDTQDTADSVPQKNPVQQESGSTATVYTVVLGCEDIGSEKTQKDVVKGSCMLEVNDASGKLASFITNKDDISNNGASSPLLLHALISQASGVNDKKGVTIPPDNGEGGINDSFPAETSMVTEVEKRTEAEGDSGGEKKMVVADAIESDVQQDVGEVVVDDTNDKEGVTIPSDNGEGGINDSVPAETSMVTEVEKRTEAEGDSGGEKKMVVADDIESDVQQDIGEVVVDDINDKEDAI